MRITDLGRQALGAEVELLRALALRNVRRVVLLVAAALFGLFCLVAAEVAGFCVLHLDASITPAWSALIVGGANLLVAVVLAAIASAGGPGPVEAQARLTRDRSLAELRTALAFASLTGPAGRLAGRGAVGLVRKALNRRRR